MTPDYVTKVGGGEAWPLFEFVVALARQRVDGDGAFTWIVDLYCGEDGVSPSAAAAYNGMLADADGKMAPSERWFRRLIATVFAAPSPAKLSGVVKRHPTEAVVRGDEHRARLLEQVR
eukprot:CAMPEP_0198307574 /NCGR_PEP_ID=MMETSP1450-20131203/421_1 /TAXON_ID=753684 ORGANISM="Madagascaria erythrocladiodes, Strain CCMP3234" /NCGR_SAMPLE_ID=MMETSP1450 /ASSEMBLY_ACC=CAM_ASM_001115 /LENGTH=117 /DNA_ID=CAMNT_0044010159 /DNA_START=8 /DNA_END=357 /DNA_ORIENTATION=-